MPRHNGRPRTYRDHDPDDIKVCCCVCDMTIWATPIGDGRYALRKVRGHVLEGTTRPCPGFWRGDHTPVHLKDRTPTCA